MTENLRPSVREAAETYRNLGIVPIPVKHGSKRPAVSGWQNLTLDADLDEMFPADEHLNIGVLLGTPSGDLVDIDCDCPEAILAADKAIGEASVRSRRGDAEASHYWFRISDGAPPATQRFEDPASPGAVLVELRSTGGQTVVPPSRHPDGTPYLWMKELTEGAIVDNTSRSEVERITRTIASIAALARYWPGPGSRHHANLALCGALLRHPDTGEVNEVWRTQAAGFARTVGTIGKDTEWRDREQNVDTTIDALEKGENVRSWTALTEYIPASVVWQVREWLGLTPTEKKEELKEDDDLTEWDEDTKTLDEEWRRMYIGKAITEGVEEPQELIPGTGLLYKGEVTTIQSAGGCLTGDTTVQINRAGKGFSKDLEWVVKQHLGEIEQENWAWDMSIPTMIQHHHDDGTVRLTEITDVWRSGKKEVFLLEAGDKAIKATSDHRFLTPSGEYVCLGNLNVGDLVGLNVGRSRGGTKDKPQYKRVTTHHHPYRSDTRVLSDGTVSGRVPKHRIVAEAEASGLSFKKFMEKCESGNHEGLVFYDPFTHAVHHYDHDTYNNHPDNLGVMTHLEHQKLHAEPKHVLERVGFLPIDRITYLGEKQTYDLTVEDCCGTGSHDSHNYLANEFVVHNSGKTLIAMNLLWRAVQNGLKVVFVDEENGPNEVARRFMTFGVDPELLDKHLIYYAMPSINWFDASNPDRLIDMCQEEKVDLVLVDSVMDMMSSSGLDENDNSEFNDLYNRTIKRLKNDNRAVLLLDHVSKDSSWMARGASAKFDQSSVVWGVKVNDKFDAHNSGSVTLKRRKGRMSVVVNEVLVTITVDGEGSTNIAYYPDVKITTGEDDEVSLHDEVVKALMHLDAAGQDKAVSKKAVRDAVPKDDHAVNEYLDEPQWPVRSRKVHARLFEVWLDEKESDDE